MDSLAVSSSLPPKSSFWRSKKQLLNTFLKELLGEFWKEFLEDSRNSLRNNENPLKPHKESHMYRIMEVFLGGIAHWTFVETLEETLDEFQRELLKGICRGIQELLEEFNERTRALVHYDNRILHAILQHGCTAEDLRKVAIPGSFQPGTKRPFQAHLSETPGRVRQPSYRHYCPSPLGSVISWSSECRLHGRKPISVWPLPA